VRITSPTATGRFTVDDVADDVLTLHDSTGAAVRVAVQTVTRLAVWRGTRSRAAGALRGAGLGLAAGAGAGILKGFASGDDPPETFFAFTAEEKAAMFAILLGGTAGIVGGVLGLAKPGERWERVQLPDAARVGVAHDGGVAVGYTLRF
jgi:hypothetical protein